MARSAASAEVCLLRQLTWSIMQITPEPVRFSHVINLPLKPALLLYKIFPVNFKYINPIRTRVNVKSAGLIFSLIVGMSVIY